LSLLKSALEDLGYKVYTSSLGRIGLRTFKEKDIDLVILDIKLPDMDGKDVLEKILEIDPKAKVLLESGYSDMEQQKDLIEIGASGFIGKPFEMNKFSIKLRTLLFHEDLALLKNNQGALIPYPTLDIRQAFL
jgi:two-component system cell cycle sensor histidine kinase/response regulator CckA